MLWVPIIIAILLFILGRVVSKRAASKTYVLPRGIYEHVRHDGRIWRAEYVERVRLTEAGENLNCLGTLITLLSFVSCMIGLIGSLILSLAPMVMVSGSEHPFKAPKSVLVTDKKAVLHEDEVWHEGVVFLTLEHVNYEQSCSELVDFDLVVAKDRWGETYVRVKQDMIDVRDEHGQTYTIAVRDDGSDDSCSHYTQDVNSLNFAVHHGYQRRLGVRVLSKDGPKPTSLTVTLHRIEDVEKAQWSIPIP